MTSTYDTEEKPDKPEKPHVCHVRHLICAHDVDELHGTPDEGVRVDTSQNQAWRPLESLCRL